MTKTADDVLEVLRPKLKIEDAAIRHGHLRSVSGQSASEFVTAIKSLSVPTVQPFRGTQLLVQPCLDQNSKFHDAAHHLRHHRDASQPFQDQSVMTSKTLSVPTVRAMASPSGFLSLYTR